MLGELVEVVDICSSTERKGQAYFPRQTSKSRVSNLLVLNILEILELGLLPVGMVKSREIKWRKMKSQHKPSRNLHIFYVRAG